MLKICKHKIYFLTIYSGFHSNNKQKNGIGKTKGTTIMVCNERQYDGITDLLMPDFG